MPYLVFLSIQNFYVRCVCAGGPEPLAILRDKTVLDADEACQTLGIEIGMPEGRARTILGRRARFFQWKKEIFEEASDSWLRACAEFSGIVEPADQHCGYVDLSAHPTPIFVADRMVESLAEQGFKVRFGTGPSKWMAQLSASIDGGALGPLTPQDLADLPSKRLSPVSPEHRERLGFLGYRTMRDVARIPMDTLREQFGDDGLLILQAARGTLSEPVKALFPPDQLTERLIFDGAVESQLVLDDALEGIGLRVGMRLGESQLQSTELIGEIEFESAAKVVARRRFNKPLRCPRSAKAALRLLFADRFSEGVLSLKAHLPKLERVRSFQPDLMGIVGYAEKMRAANASILQVREAFGEYSVRCGSDVVAPRRSRVMKEWKDATDWR